MKRLQRMLATILAVAIFLSAYPALAADAIGEAIEEPGMGEIVQKSADGSYELHRIVDDTDYLLPEDNYVNPLLQELLEAYKLDQASRLASGTKAFATQARVSASTRRSTSGLYTADSQKSAATYAAAQSIVMSVMTGLLHLNLYAAACIDAAVAVLGSSINRLMPVKAKTMVSYWYYDRIGSVKNSATGIWVGVVLCEKRLTFKHYWGSFYNTGGVVKQAKEDFNDHAYQAIKNQPSAHYTNDTWIKNTALNYYNNGLGMYHERGW